ncbi:FHA domain-containing protein [Nonomuraea sp. NPDC049480]|uniref:FHA domain-containing protein n=1 Tax=Nonomuraea sp. NPDC049480 TaxID=3364353 RepID=UPI0037A78B5A
MGDLVLDDGRDFPLDRSYVFGGEARDYVDPQDLTVQVLVDGVDEQHLAIQVDGWHLYAHDLDSASGTAIRFAEGGEFQSLPPGATVSMHPGMSIRLGSEATMTYRGRTA